jgi:hypothetical protein
MKDPILIGKPSNSAAGGSAHYYYFATTTTRSSSSSSQCVDAVAPFGSEDLCALGHALVGASMLLFFMDRKGQEACSSSEQLYWGVYESGKTVATWSTLRYRCRLSPMRLESRLRQDETVLS